MNCRECEQITKQLNKLIDVVKVVDLTEGAHVERDTLLVKVRAEGAQRDEVKRTTDIFRGQIVEVRLRRLELPRVLSHSDLNALITIELQQYAFSI
mgnify:CR=1 FL=1